MDRTIRGVLRGAFAVGAACAASAAAGAELPIGSYGGALTTADGDEASVELSFSNMAGRPLATMAMPDARMVGLSNIVVTDDALSFSYFLDGTSVQCELARREDGGLSGPCADGDGTVGSIRVSPQE
jgi:hypothetical protein